MLFASETCAPCHVLLEALGQADRTNGTLVVAADGDATKIKQAAVTPRGRVYDDILVGADTRFAVSPMRERVRVGVRGRLEQTHPS